MKKFTINLLKLFAIFYLTFMVIVYSMMMLSFISPPAYRWVAVKWSNFVDPPRQEITRDIDPYGCDGVVNELTACDPYGCDGVIDENAVCLPTAH